MQYTISYQVKDNPNYDYEEEFDTVSLAIQRACFIQNVFEIDGAITVSDNQGILVEID
jgi:hypothetical protein